jgi:hypothetical protein
MPYMKSLRNFRLASTSGHCPQFVAGKPTFVPDVAVSDAMQAGCVPVEADEIPHIEEIQKAKLEFSGDIRKSVIMLAIKAIIDKNDHKEFDGAGNPKDSVVGARLGLVVSQKEVVDAFRAINEAKSNQDVLDLHPQAQNVMRVVDAETKAELLELAAEFMVPEKATKGVASKDLRKMLLMKFSGITVK